MNWSSPGSPFRLTNHFLSASQGLSTSKVLKSHCNCPESFFKKMPPETLVNWCSLGKGSFTSSPGASNVQPRLSVRTPPWQRQSACSFLNTLSCSLTRAHSPVPSSFPSVSHSHLENFSFYDTQSEEALPESVRSPQLEMADHLIYPFNRAKRPCNLRSQPTHCWM